MNLDEKSDAMWADINERSAREGRLPEFPVRFNGDSQGIAPATLIVTPDGPRIQLSNESRKLFSEIDAATIAANLDDPRDREAWLAMYAATHRMERALTLNEACRVFFGPFFRKDRRTQSYNAYVEFRIDATSVIERFPGIDLQAGDWPTLAELRTRWSEGNLPMVADSSSRQITEVAGILEQRLSSSSALSSAKKRSALEVLKAERLRELIRVFGIEARDYRDRQALIGALADGRKIGFAEILRQLSRDELKGMCAALGLVTIGKDKSVLIERILASEPRSAQDPEVDDDRPSSPMQEPASSNTRLGAAKKRAALDVLQAERLRELARSFDIGVESYRDRDALIDGLADGRRLSFEHILEQLSRDELKSMCATLGLDDTGREKDSLINRLLRGQSPSEEDAAEIDSAENVEPRQGSAIAAIARLSSSVLTITRPERGWPSEGSVLLPTGPVPVSIYARAISRSGRSRPMERRFQNPAEKDGRIIREPKEGYALLLGLWDEQGDERAVVVAMDAYRRLAQETRVSLFMPLALLEEAADTGYAEHRSTSGETIYAFRPENLATYVERLMLEAGLRPSSREVTGSAVSVDSVLIAPLQRLDEKLTESGRVQIRPRVGMYAAFARLHYKPWFAIADFVDNSIQSYLTSVREPRADPLLIDVRIDEDEIVITDRAGGIAEADFPRAFSPSQPPPDPMGLSEFGLGMKAAACWFAKRWSVRTSALGEPVERTIEFDIPKITQEGIESLPVAERPASATDHYTVVTLSSLRVRPKGRTLGKVKEHLSSIYRVLMRDKVVRIRLTIGSTTEELEYELPKLLVAPHFREPDGPPREWRREFDFTLDRSRRVWGWAGLLATGSVSRAGFSVFRRNRLIQGSADETYRPAELFKTPNSYTYQRLVGEIFVDGFDVSHTKDGIQWDGLEEAVISRLKIELNSFDLPLLQQAEGYRARRRAQDLEAGFGLSAVTSTGAVLASSSTAEVLGAQLQKVEPDDPREPLKASEKTLTKRTFTVNVPRDQLPWSVTIELVSDRAAEWFQRGSATNIEERSIHILLNLAHPFSEQFINDAEATLAPLLRIVCGLALAEETARESGVKHAGEIRRRLNQLLREGLGTLAREQEA